MPNKLHGRAFYESIGSPRSIVAPMVDQSEFVSLDSTLCSFVAALRCVGSRMPSSLTQKGLFN